MDPKRLEKLRLRLDSKTPVLGWWRRRRAVQALARSPSPAAVRTLAVALTEHESGPLRTRVAAALRRLSQPKAINAVAAVWQETRHPCLEAILLEERWLATEPIELKVLTALKFGQAKGLLERGAEVMEPLMRACEDSDPEIAGRALGVLGGLRNPNDVEAFCDLVIRTSQSPLRKLAVEKGYVPRDPARRALFFFLMGQMDRYEALDFDHALLRANYDAAEDEVRQLIAARVRASGRPGLASVIQGGHQKRNLGGMTAREWETVIAVLRENKRYEDLWALMFEAPPEWSAEALGLLKQVAYHPGNESEAAIFDRLLKLRPPEGRNFRLYWPVPVCRAALRKHQHGVRTVAFSPDGKTLASVSYDTTSLLWDVTTGRLKTSLSKRLGLGLSAAFSPDGRTLALANVDHIARLWDVASWQQKAALVGHTDKISGLAFSPDGAILATASYDNTARVWDLSTHRCQAVLQGHQGAVLTVAVAPDGKVIATGGHDETVRLWFALSGGPKSSWTTANLSSVCTLAFSPDGRSLATGSSDGTVRFWHAANGQVKSAFPAHKGSVMSLAFSPDGTRLATAGLDKAVRLWDVAKAQIKATLDHQDEVATVAFSPDGKILATAGRDKVVRVWEIACAKPLIAMTREDLVEIQKWINVLPNPDEARPWHFVTALAKHRFRYDIELAEAAGRLFGEFDIEIEEAH